ncbi:MAG: hypothetical protein WC365_08650 [Candidatus Babeliales bacterium]|jgi:DNA repair exonuclease SbcCD ATPase subunit
MKLTDEQIKIAKENISDNTIFNQWIRLDSAQKEIMDLFDTIEALQQEKLQRIKEVSEQWAKEVVRADGLQKENEQLYGTIDRLHMMISSPNETNRIKLKICGAELLIRYTDDEKEQIKELSQMESRMKQDLERIKAEKDVLESSYMNAEMNLEHMTSLHEEAKKENERLKDRNTTYVNENANQAREIERLNELFDISADFHNPADVAEIERLKEQVALIREELEDARIFVWNGNCTDAESILNRALSTAPTTYHNPADVEALKQAGDILQDMVDVAEKCGSAYLYRRDTGKVIDLLAKIAEVGE